jgi:hypothetical protein
VNCSSQEVIREEELSARLETVQADVIAATNHT